MRNFYNANKAVIHPMLAAIMVPALTLLMNQDYLKQVLRLFMPHFPDILLPLITSSFAGLIGYALYKLDPSAAKNDTKS